MCVKDVLTGADKISRTANESSRSSIRYAIGDDARERRARNASEGARLRTDSQKGSRSVIRIPAICTQIFGASFEVDVLTP